MQPESSLSNTKIPRADRTLDTLGSVSSTGSSGSRQHFISFSRAGGTQLYFPDYDSTGYHVLPYTLQRGNNESCFEDGRREHSRWQAKSIFPRPPSTLTRSTPPHHKDGLIEESIYRMQLRMMYNERGRSFRAWRYYTASQRRRRQSVAAFVGWYLHLTQRHACPRPSVTVLRFLQY